VVRWPRAASCRELLAAIVAMPEAARSRLEPAQATAAFAVRDGAALLPPGEARAACVQDLPLPAGTGAEVQCLVLVDRLPTARSAPRRPLAHEIVRSTYRAGSQRQPNPDYRDIWDSLRELEDDDGAGLMATGEPALDLIGLVASSVLDGIDLFTRERAAAAARAKLAATPATLSSATWEPYTFEVTTLEATRSGRLRAVLVDHGSGLAWPLERVVLEQRRFRVAEERRARDRDLLEGHGGGLVDVADVAVWEQAGLRPSLLDLAAALAEVDGPGATTSVAARPAAPAPPGAGAAGMARSGSVEQTTEPDGSHRYRLVEADAKPPVMTEP
jgi:hypothetical protein